MSFLDGIKSKFGVQNAYTPTGVTSRVTTGESNPVSGTKGWEAYHTGKGPNGKNSSGVYGSVDRTFDMYM